MAQTKEERAKKKFLKAYQALCKKHGYRVSVKILPIIEELDGADE